MNKLTIEEEKKLVSDWMGWDILGIEDSDDVLLMFDKTGDNFIEMSKWKPNEDRNCWPKIWDRMDSFDFVDYELCLKELTNGTFREWHTAKPSVCWDALNQYLLPRRP